MRLLVKAELFRIWRRPFYLVPFAMVAFFAVLPLVFFVLSRVNTNYVPYLISYSGFPDGVYTLLQLGFKLFPISLAVLAAGAASEDYAAGTLKIVLPRVTSRASYLFAKHIAVVTACFTLLVGLFLAISLAGILARLGAGMPLLSGPLELGTILGVFLYFFMKSLYIGLTSIFWVTLARSQALGLILAIVTPLVMAFLVFFPGGVYLPGVQFDVLEFALLPGSRFTLEELESVIGMKPSLTFALTSVALFSIVISGISFALFQRRDVS